MCVASWRLLQKADEAVGWKRWASAHVDVPDLTSAVFSLRCGAAPDALACSEPSHSVLVRDRCLARAGSWSSADSRCGQEAILARKHGTKSRS